MTDPKLREFQRNLPMALLRARESVMEHFRPILRDHSITEQQWRVIRALQGEDGMGITALSRKTLLLMPSLTRILKSLEEQKLVKRTSSAGDSRRKTVRLARRGVDLFQKMSPLSEAEYRKIEAKLGAEKLKTLYDLLGEMYD